MVVGSSVQAIAWQTKNKLEDNVQKIQILRMREEWNFLYGYVEISELDSELVC
jgi:hypothetical protein